MFLWTYRQVIAFFVLFLLFSILIVKHDPRLDIWFERVYLALFIIVAIGALTYVLRK
jgi:hypothetical protein